MVNLGRGRKSSEEWDGVIDVISSCRGFVGSGVCREETYTIHVGTRVDIWRVKWGGKRWQRHTPEPTYPRREFSA